MVWWIKTHGRIAQSDVGGVVNVISAFEKYAGCREEHQPKVDVSWADGQTPNKA